LVIAGSPAAWALPVDQSTEGVDDDARLILALPSKAIANDTVSRCTLRIIVGSEEVSLSHGDQVTVRVLEDDPLGDDEVFLEVLEVGPLEVGAGVFDRVVDCSGDFGEDRGDQVELYAKALVEKGNCGIGCRQDRPETEVLEVELVGDDGREEVDDQAAGATEIGEGDVAGRVALDRDWFVFRTTGRAMTRLDLLYRPRGGELVASVQGDLGVVENRVVPTHDGGRLEVDLSEGIWFLVIAPASEEDPNFYDLRLTAIAAEPECDAGAVRSQPCGACGTADLTCDEQGRWSPWQEGECVDQGECSPGETLQATCERCGQRQDICADDCSWRRGLCSAEGPCDPGVWHTEDCADPSAGSDEQADGSQAGVQSRVCRDTCIWSAFGPCRTAPDGGPPCAPQTEACDDGVDNDCDGAVDADDLDCDADQTGGWRLGLSDPCTATTDCDPDPAKALECIGPPAYPMFEDGYCVQVGCLFPDVCTGAGGVCAVAFSQAWCLRPCDKQSDCRIGHHCATLGESVSVGDAAPLKACLPVCRGHSDCREGPKNYCSPRSGRCELPPDQLPGSASPSAGGSDDGGCAVMPDPSSHYLPNLWLLRR
jgi:hypothetical protein